MKIYIAGLALFVLFFVWQWTSDRWVGLNALADDIERSFPRWLRWPPDPITWVQHAGLTTLGGLGVGIWAIICGVSFTLGLAHGTTLLVMVYAVREGRGVYRQWGDPGAWWRGWPHMTGWLVDGVIDLALPVLVCAAAWAML